MSTPQASRALPEPIALLALLAAGLSSAAAAYAVAIDDAFFGRHLGAGRWALAAMLGLGALASFALLAARRRRPQPPALALVHLRIALYVFVASAALQIVFVDRYHPAVPPLSLALVLLTPVAALVLTPAWRAAVPGRLSRVADLVAMNLCIFLLLAELGLRALAAFSQSPIFESGAVGTLERIRRYGYRPGRIHFGFACNSKGFYDGEFRRKDASENRYLVASIGDSFSASIVPHSMHFTTVCEELLPGTDVMNIGCSAATPWDYAYWTRTEAIPLGADLVVLQIFLGNDISEAQDPSADGGGAWWFHKDSTLLWAVPSRVRKILKERSQPQNAVMSTGMAREGEISDKRGEWAIPREEYERSYPALRDPSLEVASFSEEAFLEIECTRALRNCTENEQDWSPFFRAISTAASHCGETPMAVVLIPDEFQVEDALWAKVSARLADRKLDRELAQKRTCAWLEREGIPYVDLLPLFRERPAEPDGNRHLYWLRDTHFNARGNALAGRALADLITRVRAAKK